MIVSHCISTPARAIGLLALALAVASPAGGQEPLLQLGELEFDPPFLRGGSTRRVTVQVELLDNPTGSRVLELQELVPQGGGDERALRVTTLRDDGRGVDDRAGDGVFARRIRFAEPAVCSRRLRVALLDDTEEDLFSPVFTLPSAGPHLPTAEYWSPFILNLDESVPIDSAGDSGRPGMLLLTVADSAPLERGSAEVEVEDSRDGELVASLSSSETCAEERIELDRDDFDLDFLIDGSPIAVRVDAIADSLSVSPLRRPSNLRPMLGEIAVAEVTAQGAPVAGAEVEFQLETDTGEMVTTVAVTDASGRARAYFPEKLANAAEEFALDAVLLHDDPVMVEAHGELTDGYGDVFEDQARVALSQSSERLVLEVGEEAIVDLALNVRVGENEGYQIDLSQEVEPETGLELRTEPRPDRIRGTGPAVHVLRQQLSALEPGTYDVFTDADLDHNEGGATSVLVVEVVPKDAGGALIIHRPSSIPGIIEPGSDVDVVFEVVVAGTETPPASLTLEEIFLDGTEEITTLLDNGVTPDTVAGDLVYTGTASIGSSSPDRPLYQVSAPAELGVGHSPRYPFEIGSLPRGPLPPAAVSGFEIIEEPDTYERFVANQLLVKFRDDVLPDRIQTIVLHEAGEEGLIGFLPLVDIVQVAIDGSGTPEEVRRAIAAFETYAEVEFASPDHEVRPAAYPNDPEFRNQTSLANVRAVEGWLGAVPLRRPGHARDIAIIDLGFDLDHPELANRVVRQGGDIVGKDATLLGRTLKEEACEQRDRERPGRGIHGTRVAGVAVAETGNGIDIAGAAPDARFVPVKVGGTTSQLICGLQFVMANTDGARIANVSLAVENNRTLRHSVEKTLETGVLLVAAAGNGTSNQAVYPAGYAEGDNGLVAVANIDDRGRAFETRQGPWVDLAAPGVAVRTLFPCARHPCAPADRVREGTGTSFSAPLVAGVASVLWSRNPGRTIQEVETMLKGAATPFTEGTDQIGAGRLDYAAVVLNGGTELDVRRPRSPAAWPGTDGSTCTAVGIAAAGNRGFFRAREGGRFLRCDGIDLAGTEKRLRVPAGIEGLTGSVKVAGIVFDATNRVRLRAYLVLQNGERELFDRDLRARASRCGELPNAPGRPRCSRWRLERFEIGELPEDARIRIEAAPIGGAGPVQLLVDDFRIQGAI